MSEVYTPALKQKPALAGAGAVVEDNDRRDATLPDVEPVVDAAGTDEAWPAPGLFIQAFEGVKRIADALDEELAEARSFRRLLVSRAGEIDASQRRTDDALRRLLG